MDNINRMFENLVSVLSDSYLVVIPLVTAYVFYRRRRDAYPLLLSLLLTIIIITAVKVAVAEPRPCSGLGAALCHDPMQSFPSRHAALVAAPLVFLLPELPVFIPYLAYVFLIGLSRVALWEHYPHDVLAGLLIGIAVGYACLRMWPKILRAIGKERRQ